MFSIGLPNVGGEKANKPTAVGKFKLTAYELKKLTKSKYQTPRLEFR